MNHDIRETIVDDLRLLLQVVNTPAVTKLLEKIATAIYPLIRLYVGNPPEHTFLVCDKCRKYNKHTSYNGAGRFCPNCLVPDLKVAQNFKGIGMYKDIGAKSFKQRFSVGGETVSDMWGEFYRQSRKFGYSVFRPDDSGMYKPVGSEAVYLFVDKKKLNIEMRIENGRV